MSNKIKNNANSTSIFDLNDDENLSSTVTNLFRSDSEFTLIITSDTGQIIKKSLSIPVGWEESHICYLFINYLNGEDFRAFSQRWKKAVFKWISDFFEYLESLEIDTDVNSTALIAPWYLEYIKDKYSEVTIVRRIRDLKKVLLWNQEKNIVTGDVKHWNDIARQTLNNIPFLESPRQKPSKTTSEKLKTTLDDNDVFLSVRAYCSWLILEMDRQRSLILNNDIKIKKSILDLIDELGVKEISRPISATEIRKNQKIHRNKINLHRRIKKCILEIIKENADDVLLEFVYMSSHHKIGNLMGVISINEIPKFNKAKMLEELEKKDFALGYSLLDFLRPSPSEACAISYLLATERIQETGQNKLEISDCVLDHKGVQFVGYEKPRSSQKSKITAHYPSNSFIYHVYETWKKNISAYQQFSVKGRRLNYFNFLTPEQCRDKLKYVSRSTVLFYLPLLFDSLSRKQAMKVEPRTKLYMEAMLGNYEVFKHQKRYESSSNQFKPVQPRISVPIRVGIKALSQTRGNLESKPISGLSFEANDLIDANLSAHSPEVKKNTYIGRTASNSVLKSGFEFSKSVSDKMIADAGRVAELLNSTEVVTIKNLEMKLGIEAPLDKYIEDESIDYLLEEAEKKGYTVGKIAELNNEGKTIIICTPLVAALILGEIRHIENNINDLANINPFKVNQYKTRKMFLQEVTDSFPNKIIKKGKQMLVKYNFPYPPIS